MAFENFPYSNFHDLNLDWILNEIKKVVTEWKEQQKDFENLQDAFNALKEYVNSALVDDAIRQTVNARITEMYNNGELSEIIAHALQVQYTYVSAFGAVGDGITDDTNAIKNAIASANHSGTTVLFDPKKYMFTAGEIETHCSIDFNGATLIAASGAGFLFNITPDVTTADRVITESDIQNDRTTISDLFNKSFLVTSPLSLGTRSGSATPIYHKQLLETDGSGLFINSCYYPTIIPGNYTITNIQTTNKPLTFKNVIIDYSNISEDTDFIGVFNVYRNNIILDNIKTNGMISNTGWTRAVISINECLGVNINNCNIINPSTATGSGYAIGIYDCSNIEITNCVLKSGSVPSWGCIGVSSVTNYTVKNTITNRLDIHYESNGYVDYQNCVTSIATIAGGYGDINFSNCTFLNFGRSYAAITLRQDLPVILSGNVIFNNCIYNDSRNSAHAFASITMATAGNITNLNHSGFNLVIKNLYCKSLIGSLVEVSMPNNTYAELININVSNTAILNRSGNRGIIRNVNTNYPINTITIYNCNISGNRTDIDFYCLNAIITNCILPVFAFDNASTNYNITGCAIATHTNNWKGKNLIVTNNKFASNTAVTISATNYVVNNNIITGSTKTNLSTINNKLG